MAANDQLDELRAQLEDIRKQVNAGALFQSLGKKLEPLISSVKREPTISTLRLPDDDDGIRAILSLIHI